MKIAVLDDYLHLMKPTAILINTSRGPLVEEEALLAALRENRIAGAGLDVYHREPLPDDDPIRRLPLERNDSRLVRI